MSDFITFEEYELPAKKMSIIQCPRCLHEWEPRVQFPKQCPKCHMELKHEDQPVIFRYSQRKDAEKQVSRYLTAGSPFVYFDTQEMWEDVFYTVEVDRKTHENLKKTVSRAENKDDSEGLI